MKAVFKYVEIQSGKSFASPFRVAVIIAFTGNFVTVDALTVRQEARQRGSGWPLADLRPPRCGVSEFSLIDAPVPDTCVQAGCQAKGPEEEIAYNLMMSRLRIPPTIAAILA